MHIKKIIIPSLALFFLNQAIAQPVMFKQGMVVSTHHLASEVGRDILKAGGNAIDAAVAMGYALAVVHPCCGNIGGGGFMTIHLARGKNIFLNFREKAPLRARANLYLDAQGQIIPGASTKGYRAVGVPGTVLGFETALRRYGTLSRQQVMAPAIRLAKQGFRLSSFAAMMLNRFRGDFLSQPQVAAIFTRPDRPYQAGDPLIQTDLAHTLQAISADGPAVFYRGRIAQTIVQASTAHHGLLTLTDFKQYRVEERTPIQCTYRGYTVISAPPPSSGGVTLCEMLNVLEFFPLTQLGYHSAPSAHAIIEAMRYGFNDRNSQLGDPDFVDNPVTQLTSKSYAKQIFKKIQSTSPLLTPASASESPHTTHYSVVDRYGNAVSVTYTLNGFFGAKVIAGDTGFFLNNEMDDFTSQAGVANKFKLIQQDTNNIQPGKRPLSSMTPTIVLHHKQLFMVLGSPGGPRIITAVMLTLLNVIDYHMSIQQAVNAPRFHYQVHPDAIDVEPNTFTPAVRQALSHLYHFALQPPWGAVEAILVDPTHKRLYGANDDRRPDGAAISEESLLSR
jgi:gamma-glutamyltranspeptidase / glutathione hydrolase